MTNLPVVETKAGKRGFTAPWLTRYAEKYVQTLNWTDQNVWRKVVQNQGIALLCRETIINKLATMNWRIEPRDPQKRQELRLKIQYYTDLFLQNKNQNLDFIDLVSSVVGDGLDLPFGGGVELVRAGDRPSGKLLDYVPLDGATLFPTFNTDYPVVQRTPDLDKYVPFPKHAFNRYYYSFKNDIRWRNWGFPPPQKIYVALQMISKGDDYYWKLLIDTPEVGILDLLDMDKESAEQWITSFRDLMTGIDPFKIPVLYEHTSAAQYIPFSRSPAEIQFDKGLSRYDAVVAGGYGLSLSSLGFQVVASGGETLAGSIRQERNERRQGIGLAKIKFKLFMDRMLPSELEFAWIDPDDEQQVSKGRAMLASSTAHNNWINARVISPTEARADLISSGLLATTIPEELPDDPLFDEIDGGENQDRENMLTATQPPSAGGQGEVRQSKVTNILEKSISTYLDMIDEYPEYPFSLSSDLIDEMVNIFSEVVEAEKKSHSIFSFRRYKTYSLSENTVLEYIRRLENNFAAMYDKAKSNTLDNGEDFLDNVKELLISEMLLEISDFISHELHELIGDLDGE